MKIYLSADMEGLALVSAREEVTKGDVDYGAASRQMSREVSAACDGAFAAGAKEIWIKDAHWTGRNLDADLIACPAGKTIRMIRGWSGHPFAMVQELDDTFSGAMFLGYHSAAGSSGNPLSHTLSSRLLAKVLINDEPASEFLIYSLAAATVNVPVLFLAGDETLCQEARRQNEGLATVATMKGKGSSIVSMHPGAALEQIRALSEEAVRAKRGRVMPLASSYRTQIVFHDHREAFRRSFYPGATLTTDFEVTLEAKEYFDVLRFLRFMTM